MDETAQNSGTSLAPPADADLGRVVRVSGSVVDVAFPEGALPPSTPRSRSTGTGRTG